MSRWLITTKIADGWCQDGWVYNRRVIASRKVDKYFLFLLSDKDGTTVSSLLLDARRYESRYDWLS